jgi:hypothetical protein
MLMESGKQIGAEAATHEGSKMRGEARVKAAESYPIVLRSYEPAASMSDYDASSRYLVFRRCKVNAQLDLLLRRFALGVHNGSAEPFLGMGFGDRFEVAQGDSGLLKGGVHLTDETA